MMMRRFAGATIVAALAIGASDAAAQCEFDGPAEVRDGFLSGQDLVDYSDRDLAIYVMGYVNGLFIAPMMDAPKSCVRLAEGCVEGMNNVQLAAILRKYLNENPETWHQGAHIVTYRALAGRCMFSN